MTAALCAIAASIAAAPCWLLAARLWPRWRDEAERGGVLHTDRASRPTGDDR